MTDITAKKHNFIYLSAILLLGGFLRLIFLDSIPNGFFCDEASNAYDSYSLLTNLKDQHGNFLPLFTRSIDDYREALFMFLGIPFIKVFGLNEFAARMPAAVIGILTIIVLYLLVKELFDTRTALVSALFLAISPWHIQFSRIAFRAILIPFLFCLALLFFVKSFKQPKFLPVSSLIFALSLYTYASARVFVPLFMLGLVIIFWQHFWQNKKETFISLFLFSIVFIPLLIFWLSPAGMARAKGTGLETNITAIIKYYFSYFNPIFLFFKGDPITRHSAAKIGELYYFEIITVFWGIICLLKENKQIKSILFLWLFLYPLPAAITSPSHALRAISGAPLFAIISAYGLVKLFDLLQPKFKKIASFSVGLILIASLAILTKTYFIDYPLYTTKAWQYGIREAISYGEKHNYQCIVMSNQTYLRKCGSLHVFVPFYTQYPPSEYQKSVISPETRINLFHGRTDYQIGKYKIASVDKKENLSPKCLYIVPPEELDKITAQGYAIEQVHSVKDKRGIEYLKLVELNKIES